MQNIIDGIRFFQSNQFALQKELFASLAKGQRPKACFITCSDSRIDPNLITTTDPGDLFIVRNPGNIVPPLGAESEGEAAAVEYAVAALGVEDIVVCGHTQCGAMKGLLHPEALSGLPRVSRWLEYAAGTRQIMQENYGHLHGEELLDATAEENVLVQLEHLHTHPVVAARLGRGKVRLHGWVYSIATGQMFAYDSEYRQFLPLG